MESFTFFWRGHFSQWYKSKFTVANIQFTCAEQYMMYKKAEMFGDKDVMQKILATDNPKTHKALGREVKNFKKDEWNKLCKQIVYDGNYAKFSQNETLKKQLLEASGTLVEASPHDIIWGIGMSEDNPDVFDRTKWKGKNWLGEVLTEVKKTMQEEEKK